MEPREGIKVMNHDASSPEEQHTHSRETLDRRIERAKYVYEQVNGWIENADTKVATSTGVSTGVFGVLTFVEEKIKAPDAGAMPDAIWNAVHKFCYTCGFVALAAAIILFTLAIFPNLKSSGKQGGSGRFLLYYGDICKAPMSDFERRMHRSSDRAFLDELIREVHLNATTCMRKMKRYRTGLVFSTLAIALAFMNILARYLMY